MLNRKVKGILALGFGASLCLVTTNLTATGVYKWVDDEGNVHYSDRTNISAEKLKVDATRGSRDEVDERNEKRDRLLSVMQEERLEKKLAKAEADKNKAQRKAKCEKAQDNLKQYQTAGYLYRLDEQGNRHVLEGEEYTEAMKQANDEVKHWCG